jgi:hypothetical protein
MDRVRWLGLFLFLGSVSLATAIGCGDGSSGPAPIDVDTPYFMAFSDHQVANVATEAAARTIGARLREPALSPGRSTAVQPFFGIEPVPSYPWPGSGLVVWDFGNPPPPTANLPPREGEDPHGKGADVVEVLILVSEYLKPGGALVDVCNGAPCATLD